MKNVFFIEISVSEYFRDTNNLSIHRVNVNIRDARVSN